ncbi:MAG: hypothetical protein WD274_04760 [Acidimicrobiia bacterium]
MSQDADGTERPVEPSALDLDFISRRLGEISTLLDGSARDPSPEHFALLSERDQLRAEAANLRPGKDNGRSVAQLEAELASLQQRRRALVTARSGYATGKGGNNQGPGSAAWVKLSVQSREASGMTQLTTRISEIEDELARRGGEN